MALRTVPGGVTAPEDFLAAGVYCGIRQRKEDLALIFSRRPAAAAGLMTTNRVQAAPLAVTREHLADGRLRAVVANSGIANACTGERGLADARRMAELAGAALGIPPTQVGVASTGVVGMFLPLPALEEGIPRAVGLLSREGGAAAARAILTTDTVPKEAAVAVELAGRHFRVGGMAKGSGMIHPELATMLAFLTTDAPVALPALRAALAWAVDRSFNCVSVDGDTSPNDLVLLLANGAAGGAQLTEEHPDFPAFREAVGQVAQELARDIARDGEGASKLLEVTVRGAASYDQARKAARTVAASALVKAAVHGADPNWGRVAVALGYAGVGLDPQRLAVALGEVAVVRGGMPLDYDEAAARAALEGDTVRIVADLGAGTEEATAWGCDLSCEYVRINASYRS